jgi:integrase
MQAMKGCRPLSDAEIGRVAGSFAGRWALRDRALFILGHRTGYRVSELLSLTVADVLGGRRPGADAPITPGMIADRIAVRRRRMKRKLEGRSVATHAEARRALADWLEEMRTRGLLAADSPVFLSRKAPRRRRGDSALPFDRMADLPPSDAAPTGRRSIGRVEAWRILHGAFGRADVWGQTGTHSLRKTFAHRVDRRAKGDLMVVQQALGHRSIDSTVRYLARGQSQVDDVVTAEDE